MVLFTLIIASGPGRGGADVEDQPAGEDVAAGSRLKAQVTDVCAEVEAVALLAECQQGIPSGQAQSGALRRIGGAVQDGAPRHWNLARTPGSEQIQREAGVDAGVEVTLQAEPPEHGEERGELAEVGVRLHVGADFGAREEARHVAVKHNVHPGSGQRERIYVKARGIDILAVEDETGLHADIMHSHLSGAPQGVAEPRVGHVEVHSEAGQRLRRELIRRGEAYGGLQSGVGADGLQVGEPVGRQVLEQAHQVEGADRIAHGRKARVVFAQLHAQVDLRTDIPEGYVIPVEMDSEGVKTDIHCSGKGEGEAVQQAQSLHRQPEVPRQFQAVRVLAPLAHEGAVEVYPRRGEGGGAVIGYGPQLGEENLARLEAGHDERLVRGHGRQDVVVVDRVVVCHQVQAQAADVQALQGDAVVDELERVDGAAQGDEGGQGVAVGGELGALFGAETAQAAADDDGAVDFEVEMREGAPDGKRDSPDLNVGIEVAAGIVGGYLGQAAGSEVEVQRHAQQHT